jgi:hypothetical protein
MSNFPVYRDHREVCCFKCEEQLDHRGKYDSGNAPGRGFWAQDCRACGLSTFYDVESSNPYTYQPADPRAVDRLGTYRKR